MNVVRFGDAWIGGRGGGDAPRASPTRGPGAPAPTAHLPDNLLDLYQSSVISLSTFDSLLFNQRRWNKDLDRKTLHFLLQHIAALEKIPVPFFLFNKNTIFHRDPNPETHTLFLNMHRFDVAMFAVTLAPQANERMPELVPVPFMPQGWFHAPSHHNSLEFLCNSAIFYSSSPLAFIPRPYNSTLDSTLTMLASIGKIRLILQLQNPTLSAEATHVIINCNKCMDFAILRGLALGSAALFGSALLLCFL